MNSGSAKRATKERRGLSRAGLIAALMCVAGFAALLVFCGCHSQLNAKELSYIGTIAPRTEHFPAVSVPRTCVGADCAKTNAPPTTILD